MNETNKLFEIGTCIWFAEDTKPSLFWLKLDLPKIKSGGVYVYVGEIIYNNVKRLSIALEEPDEKEDE